MLPHEPLDAFAPDSDALAAARPQAGKLRPGQPLAQLVLRYTGPDSAEFNDMQQVIFSHVDVSGIGGERAVATVGTPLAFGLPVALERPHTRGRLEATLR